ncbi:GNAT family N-acetyltransferase [Rheinheimera sp. 4Y26]|uniref:GNAT family N-acetyltransferase n=1 Tax=Rheinheimera sp. 4Y26 TaxID=2977811 RepID=UPI0021B1234D|nr:GNAT family N-acetyltransferase [Rheinheimera sp. 4Y26]MCT6699274.1 GNAT family N-acetyltransferase [Rheinheimera sp. 4Y26]
MDNAVVTQIRLRPAAESDAAAIALIYNHYIEHSTVTFEQSCLTDNEMLQRMQAILSSELPFLVLEKQGLVLGYAYASPWRARIGYRFSVESSVYLSPGSAGLGYGSLLMQQLLQQLTQAGYHAVIAGIALPNDASVALHEKFGMTKVAHFYQVGTKFGQWLDVGYWQLLLPNPKQDFGQDAECPTTA